MSPLKRRVMVTIVIMIEEGDVGNLTYHEQLTYFYGVSLIFTSFKTFFI